MIHLVQHDPRRAQTITNRLRRKPSAVLEAIKALLLHRRDQLPVDNQSSRSVTVVSVDSENNQWEFRISNCEFRIYKLPNSGIWVSISWKIEAFEKQDQGEFRISNC